MSFADAKLGSPRLVLESPKLPRELDCLFERRFAGPTSSWRPLSSTLRCSKALRQPSADAKVMKPYLH